MWPRAAVELTNAGHTVRLKGYKSGPGGGPVYDVDGLETNVSWGRLMELAEAHVQPSADAEDGAIEVEGRSGGG